MKLVEFLKARLDEDEQEAREAQLEDTGGANWGSGAVLISPARMLAEVRAKRRIIADHEQGPKYGTQVETIVCYRCGDPPGYDYEWMASPCPTLKLLALPYSGHPDYDPAWRP